MASGASHESFDRDEETRAGSDRGFAIVFTVVFALVGSVQAVVGRPWWAGGLAVAAVLMLALGLLAPVVLRPLNRLWFRFGLALHHVVNPVVMGLIFFLTVTPTALVMRALGKDPLHRRFLPGAESYWIVRDPPGPVPETLENQF